MRNEFGPRTAIAGLPGIIRSRAKLITVTSSTTMTDCSTLRSRKTVTHSPAVQVESSPGRQARSKSAGDIIWQAECLRLVL